MPADLFTYLSPLKLRPYGAIQICLLLLLLLLGINAAAHTEGGPQSGFELDRNAPERRSGSFFKAGTAFRFIFLKIPNENQIAVVAYTQVCFHPWQF